MVKSHPDLSGWQCFFVFFKTANALIFRIDLDIKLCFIATLDSNDPTSHEGICKMSECNPE